MDPPSRFAPLALKILILLGLGFLVFYRSGLKQQVFGNAPGSAGTSTQQTFARQTAALELSFRAEGIAFVDEMSSKGPSVGTPPSTTADSGVMIESTLRDLFIEGHATELGVFQGILDRSRFLAGRRIANLTLHGGDNNAIRLILRARTTGASDDCTGTYIVVGGSGQFARATGSGCYRCTPIVPPHWETVSIALDGRICY